MLHSSVPMVSEHSILGVCPRCETEIPEGLLLIEYETDGDRRVFAECPACEEPVTPE